MHDHVLFHVLKIEDTEIILSIHSSCINNSGSRFFCFNFFPILRVIMVMLENNEEFASYNEKGGM